MEAELLKLKGLSQLELNEVTITLSFLPRLLQRQVVRQRSDYLKSISLAGITLVAGECRILCKGLLKADHLQKIDLRRIEYPCLAYEAMVYAALRAKDSLSLVL